VEYSIITYKTNKNVRPNDIVVAISDLMKKYSVYHKKCLFKASDSIVEYELDGVFHSNRNKNSVARICKAYPQLNAFLKQTAIEKDEGRIDEETSICNFCDVNYSETGKIDDSAILEIASKIPRPYNPNHVEIIYDGISLSQSNQSVSGIAPPINGFGLPVGNYILYERDSYGSEKHSYIHFSADSLTIDHMREMFLEFTKTIPGKYEGTEIKNQ
jgi:hypothetical protein